MAKNCKHCNTLLSSVGKGSRASFCNNNHRHQWNKTHESSLRGTEPIQPQFNAKAKAKMNPKAKAMTPIASQPDQAYSQTAEFLLREKINELKGVIEELKVKKNKLEDKLENKVTQYCDLEVKYNTVKRDHEQELSGIEQGQKTWVRELTEFVRDKDAMGNIIDAYSAVKGGGNQNKELAEAGDAEEMTALKNFFYKLTPEHQMLLTENLYAYGRRPDLMIKQNLELKKYLQK